MMCRIESILICVKCRSTTDAYTDAYQMHRPRSLNEYVLCSSVSWCDNVQKLLCSKFLSHNHTVLFSILCYCWIAKQTPTFPLLPSAFGRKICSWHIRNSIKLAHHLPTCIDLFLRNNFHCFNVQICCMLFWFGRCTDFADNGNGCCIFRG